MFEAWVKYCFPDSLHPTFRLTVSERDRREKQQKNHVFSNWDYANVQSIVIDGNERVAVRISGKQGGKRSNNIFCVMAQFFQSNPIQKAQKALKIEKHFLAL